MTLVPLDHLSDEEIEHLYDLGLVPDEELERLYYERVSPEDRAVIDAIAFGLARLLNTPIAQLVADADEHRALHGGPVVGGIGDFFGDIGDALKGAVQSVASFVHHPPGWFATIFPLFTMENQRYWAQKLGGSTGAALYDTGVKAIASQYLGPQGPALVEAYNKVTEDAAQGNLNAKEILSHAPQIAKLAAASRQGPDAFRAAVAETKSAVKVSGEGEHDMSAYAGWDYVGAEGHSYPEVAARAVQGVHRQTPSAVYGYFRTGPQQKIYLFGTVDDARGWITALIHGQAQPYDYAAVFAADDLTRPVAGLESFGHTTVSGDVNVGQIWPFFLGLPLGGLAGYFLRRWQEGHPGQAVPFVPPGKLPAPNIPAPPPGAPPPKTSGDYGIGGPWLDIEPVVSVVGCEYGAGYTVGGPWVDVVGAQVDDRARIRSWPQTKALIHSAIKEVKDAAAQMPAATAYVWSLDPPSSSAPSYTPSSTVTLEGTTSIMSFTSAADALDYMRERIQTPHVALALFDRSSPHWPNPTNWTKSNDPAYEPVIAQQAAKYAPTRAAGDYVGAWGTSIGSALDDVRSRAQSIAAKRDGRVIGVIHTSKDNLWHALAFTNSDDADDWLGTATHDPSGYTYAAYYDKDDFSWPHAVNEKIGGGRPRSKPGEPIRRGPATVAGNWWAA